MTAKHKKISHLNSTPLSVLVSKLRTPIAPPGVPPSNNRPAPRSGQQFRVGPPFHPTQESFKELRMDGRPVKPIILARIDRGLDFVDDEWIGYKRNYFTTVAAFHFDRIPNELTLTSRFQCCGSSKSSKSYPVKYFQLSLDSECPGDPSREVTLVQHTAKRDHGPQSKPPIYNIIPGNLPGHNIIRLVSNIRNDAKVSSCNRLFFLDTLERYRLKDDFPKGLIATYPEKDPVALAARYDRVQFQFATSAPGNNKSKHGKPFVLKISLSAIVEDGLKFVVASVETPPLVIRGRSPSTYSLNLLQVKKQALQNSLNINLELEGDKENQTPSKIGKGSDSVKRGEMAKAKPLSQRDNNLGGRRKESCNLFELCFHEPSPKLHLRKALVSVHNNDAEFLVTILGTSTRPRTIDKALQKAPKLERAAELREETTSPESLSQAFGENSNRRKYSMNSPLRMNPEDLRKGFATYPFEYRFPNSQLQKESPFLIYPDNKVKLEHEEHSLAREYGPNYSLAIETKYSKSPQLTTIERLEKTMKEYEETKIELEALSQLSAYSSHSDNQPINSSVVPFSLYLLEQVTTSTPLPSKFGANIPKKLSEFPLGTTRCIHGMKRRTAHSELRKYTDLDFQNTDDSSFLLLKEELNQMRQKLWHSVQSFSLTSLPLSSIDSEVYHVIMQ